MDSNMRVATNVGDRSARSNRQSISSPNDIPARRVIGAAADAGTSVRPGFAASSRCGPAFDPHGCIGAALRARSRFRAGGCGMGPPARMGAVVETAAIIRALSERLWRQSIMVQCGRR